MKANRYDLSASRYRQVEQEEMYYENAPATLQKFRALDEAMRQGMDELEVLLK